MEPVCPIDSKCRDQISALLKPPSNVQVQKYFEKLIVDRQCKGLRVSPNGDYGKGVYADMDFKEDDLVLKDPVLFGIQHSSNKLDCSVCYYCFQFIGSIERQIGKKLYWKNFIAGRTMQYEEIESLIGLEDCLDHGDDIGAESDEQETETEQCGTSGTKSFVLPCDVIESLMNGGIQLPYSDQFQLPATVYCPGGCMEAFYCSKFCAEADWNLYHSLLCTGKETKCLNTQSLWKFIEHANDTNDIFLLAAKVISFTILRYRNLKAAYLRGKEKYDGPNLLDSHHFPLLIEAWKPVSMGYKKRWWDCISLPEDVSDEAAFRLQIKELAFSSLQLLKAAIFDPECEPLFSLEIYGHIIGMFELNNLNLVVESPVEKYFLYIENLPHDEKDKAEQITEPFLDALGEDYSSCCEGTGFYPLQSCMNHSCCPNVKAFKRDEDIDGQAMLIALKRIQNGEEITVSYINEQRPYKERQKLLADYGFTCRCPKCIQEEPTS